MYVCIFMCVIQCLCTYMYLYVKARGQPRVSFLGWPALFFETGSLCSYLGPINSARTAVQ